ncbi:heavy-metal-associated domain-containing protein [Litorimonas sp. WD9-15]|uniref:heavy-metal-associated domain-containing protein n=1 Tax=Litorimonas sp. WD9-15 TaxID=3418716 RepID=UPI003CFF5436
MFRIILITAALAISTPAFAQDHSGHGSDYKGDHAGHDHKVEDHSGHDMSMTEGSLRLADQAELTAAIAAGGEPIVAKVLGAVCDFCAKAMNKTFGKRDDVAAVYVDLDAKTLNLVLKPGATMTDEALRKAVKKSGYKVDSIARGAATISG